MSLAIYCILGENDAIVSTGLHGSFYNQHDNAFLLWLYDSGRKNAVQMRHGQVVIRI